MNIKKKNTGSGEKKSKRIILKCVPYTLNEKVDEFLKSYYEQCVLERNIDESEYQSSSKLRNLIEKMAVWYELRYPDFEVNRIYPISSSSNMSIDDIMFNENEYFMKKNAFENDKCGLKWADFYNYQAFYASLSLDEKYYLSTFSYPSIVYWNTDRNSTHFHLNEDGTIESAEYVSVVLPQYKDEDFVGFHIMDVLDFASCVNIKAPTDGELYTTVMNYLKKMHFRNELLDCVMYRIIERGGDRYGARRGFLFAREFDRDISAVIKYGIDLSDPGLRGFINEYLKVGGSPNLMCYINYADRKDMYDKLYMSSVEDILSKCPASCAEFYTQEEKDLQKRFVDLIGNRINELNEKERVRK